MAASAHSTPIHHAYDATLHRIASPHVAAEKQPVVGWHGTTLERTHFWLLTRQTPIPHTHSHTDQGMARDEKSIEMAVFALLVKEYTLLAPTHDTPQNSTPQPYHSPGDVIFFIDKVDKSGFATTTAPAPYHPSPPATTTLRHSDPPAVLDTFAREVIAPLTQSAHRVSIHLAARPAPWYIFPRSDDVSAASESPSASPSPSASDAHPNKHTLTPSQLLRWWVRTVDIMTASLSSALPSARTTIRKMWFSPGYDSPTDAGMRVTEPSARAGGWVWGTPFSPRHRARDVVPVFADDPKGRLLSAGMEEPELQEETVEQFWDRVGASGDAGAGGGRVNGIVFVTVEGGKEGGGVEQGGDEERAQLEGDERAPTTTTPTLTPTPSSTTLSTLLTTLTTTLDFSTLTLAASSSASLLKLIAAYPDHLKRVSPLPLPASVQVPVSIPVPAASAVGEKRPAERAQDGGNAGDGGVKTSTVNTVLNVRKKPKTA
ncbi:hypothetical protein M427DRAFT_74650 [Gonapodya prolifera JEL478]|uniref:histone acetyltransferase n=1 Tax=Gonapodya prolifera (strain JEL478) TaxID=1344416 RepID=A0A138ZZS2_GONPJ|nr:hypothetical protein M427DRAFT_74650 [Gonapodya prolifera JEL478]|eukprot:KXS10001.1 hypothetical protein M427DRAFT_74650 [Gonapodya prolifera JEL478]